MNYIQGKSTDVNQLNNWFEHCEINNIPNIYIIHRRKYSKVHWNDMSMHPSYKERLNETHISFINDTLKSIFYKYCNSKSKYEISPILGYFDNFYPDDACKAADEIYNKVFETLCA